jgi:replicative DNA helicase
MTNTIPIPELAEAAIIGSILIKPDVMLDVFDKIAPDDFAIAANRWLAEAAWGCFNAKMTPTYAAIVDRLRASGRFSDAMVKTAVTFSDIDAILASVTEQDLPAIGDHVRLVRDASLRRAGLSSVTNAAKLFCDMDRDLDLIERDVFSRVGQVFDRAGGRDANVASIGGEEQARIDKIGEGDVAGIPCGIEWLDELTGGFLPSEAWVIAAPYKMRKTTLALNMTISCARNDAPISLFTVGDSSRGATYRKLIALVMNEHLVSRGIDHLTALSSRALQYPIRVDDYRDVYAYARKVVDGWPIRLYDGQDKIGNLAEASRILRRDAALYGTRIFVYDYAQAVYSGKNDYERTSAFVTWMQQMTGEYGMTGVAISQLNEETIKSGGESYSPGAKGGGALPAMANVFLVTKYLEPDMTIELKLARDSRVGDKRKHALNPASGLILDNGQLVKQINLNQDR